MRSLGLVIKRFVVGKFNFTAAWIDEEEAAAIAWGDGVGESLTIGIGVTAGGIIEINDGDAGVGAFSNGAQDVVQGRFGGVNLIIVWLVASAIDKDIWAINCHRLSEPNRVFHVYIKLKVYFFFG